jgi:hypothetical protein
MEIMQGAPQSRSGRFGDDNNILAPPGFEHRVDHPRRYTDDAISAP